MLKRKKTESNSMGAKSLPKKIKFELSAPEAKERIRKECGRQLSPLKREDTSTVFLPTATGRTILLVVAA
jgi:hypothetical protein